MAANDRVFIGGMPLTLAKRSATQYDLVTSAANVTTKFREAFENYNPISMTAIVSGNDRWRENKASGDIAVVDGNAIASSYLDLSLDPLTQGTETVIESVANYGMPFEFSVGAHMSQRTLGQEFALEFVNANGELPPVADIEITSLSQTTNTLTVTTNGPHGFTAGKSIGIRGFADSRVNYPALVVASTPAANQFTATAGPGGTIPSLTVGPLTGGFVYFRERLGRANEGTSIIFENTTATNASFYIRSESGDALTSGTAIGNHSTTIASTASVQAINAAYTYAFQPTTEFRLRMMADKLQWSDIPVDSTSTETARVTRTQVIPSPDALYKLRIRATNNKSLTVPVGRIVSATKAGSTTATIVFDAPHGLTTSDQIVIYGIRDQTNFANLTTATAVASVVDASTITIAFGASFTGVSYGGYVSRVQAGNAQGGAITQVISTATLTNGELVLVGNAAWTGLVIGDYVNVHGCRIDLTGADRGVDGAWKVANIATTTLTLVKPQGQVAPSDFGSTNCGGAVIKRTCLRLSFIRVFDFERARFEATPRPTGDQSGVMPVNVQNTPAVTVSSGTVTTVTTVSTVSALTGGGVAEDAAAGANPVITGGVVRTATTPVTLVAGDAVRDTHAGSGAKVIKPYAVPEAGWNANLSLTTTTAAAIAAAAGASLKRHITALQAINTGASAVDLIVLDGATERWRLTLPINVPVAIEFPTELITTANTALNANLSAAGTVRACFQGYTSS